MNRVLKIIKDIPKVENLKGAEKQFVITTKDLVLFQSYNSPIVAKHNGQIYIFRDWDYSTTTSKYRNLFLNEKKNDTLKKLKSGEYVAVDFNLDKYRKRSK